MRPSLAVTRALMIGAVAGLAAPAAASAQEAPDRAAILALLDRYFGGIRARDTTATAAVVDPKAITVGVTYSDGRATVTAGPASGSRTRVAATATPAEERLLKTEVWQDGDVAMVWAPFEVRRGGALVVCGYDAIDLMRRDGRWLMAGTAYTSGRDRCPAVHAAAAGPMPLAAPDTADRSAVLAAVDGFFTALRERDTAALRRLYSPRAAWNTASYRNGQVTLAHRPASDDIPDLARAAEPYHERMFDAVVRVDGDLALVWGPYQFSVGEKLSHCGHDGFRLVREDGRWRFEGGVYTVRPDGCVRLLSPRQIDSLPARVADTVIAWGREPQQTGELRLPTGAGPFPVAVVIHGGCWQRAFASARNTAALADALRAEGIATWNIEYRTADEPGGGWPGTFLDVSAATDYLRTLARRYPLDTTRVVTVGHSAGGHLALWLAGRAKVPAGSPIRRPAPLRLAGAVGLGPVMDLGETAARIGGVCGRGATMVVGGPPTAVPDRHAAAAPIELLPLGVPQAVVMGELDGIIPARPREAYVRKGRGLGDRIELVVIPDAGHFELIAPNAAAWPAVLAAIRRMVPP